MKIISLLSMLLVVASVLLSQEKTIIKLPPPQKTGGKPLMETLALRQSNRSFSSKPLPITTLSNLLWAANGINRLDSGKRTAPSARNMQEIDIYVALPEGLYYYEPKAHALQLVVAQDLRGLTGSQPFCAQAALNLIFVSDYDKMGNLNDEQKSFYSATDAGFVSQNVYLFCASAGLNTVVRASLNRESLAESMGLRPTQKIILAQTVGYPAE
jgi:SagB-type dehydrogenase family enzyme